MPPTPAYSPPLWQEVLSLLTLLAAGLACLRLGRTAGRRSARAGGGVALTAGLVAVLAAAAHYPPLRDIAGPWLILPGGEASLACLAALTLIGVAGADRKKRLPLLHLAAGLVLLLLTTLTSGSLGWRLFGQRLRANYPDARGALQQTTGITCGPAAASMLLHHAGIRISEGELAELANTTPLQGTAPHALARAVDHAARRHTMRGHIQRVDYEEAVRLGRPFVAFVTRPGVGRHSICVVKATSAGVLTLDPLSGTGETLPREEFTGEWDPVVVWVEGRRPSSPPVTLPAAPAAGTPAGSTRSSAGTGG
jgi:hypothetical protein